jgi:hypothetical protein
VAALGSADVAGDPLSLMEDFDGGGGDARVELGPGERERHAIAVVVDPDMVIETGTTALMAKT